MARDLLRRLEEALADPENDRRAAASDRRAAAADRQNAAQDRDLQAAHRGQAAIEWAQQRAGLPSISQQRWAELYAHAQSARDRATALSERARVFGMAAPSAREMLRRSELARMRAQLGTMPVIEQAKGIIMAQGGCGDAEAFGYPRRA